MTHLPITLSAALINFTRNTMRFVYNQYQKIGRLTRLNHKYKRFLVKFGLFKLVNAKLNQFNQYEFDNIKPLSQDSINSRASKFVDLLLTHDASINIAQEFLLKFLDLLYKKHDNVQEHLQQKLLPIIIRDINTSIQDYRNDPTRSMREAFANKSMNLSQRKSLKNRKYVCTYIFSNPFL